MKLEDQEYVYSPYTGKKINMQKLLQDQRIAASLISSEFPFFDELLYRLKVVYTFMIPTQATDGIRLLVNPEFTDELDINGKAFVMMHEVMHCALNHMYRGRNHDHERSNIAADYEVNDTLVSSDFVNINTINKLGALYKTKYNGWMYERIYNNCEKSTDEVNKYFDKSNQQSNSKQQSNSNQQKGNNSNQQDQQQSPEYVDGWNKAIEDYKAGKIKL